MLTVSKTIKNKNNYKNMIEIKIQPMIFKHFKGLLFSSVSSELFIVFKMKN